MDMRSITVPALTDQLIVVNRFIAESVPPDYQALLPKIELVLEELMVNVCTYAYGNEGRIEISLRAADYEGRPHLELTVCDWGAPFDPFSQSAEPEMELGLSDRPVGGLGVHLVKKLASGYCYEYSQGANLSRVIFERPGLN